MKATLYPGADTKARWKGNGNATLSSIDKIVLHTTESVGLPSFSGNWPNVAYDPATRKWWHCTPINGSATALKNDGPHRTNRENVVQVEIVGYAKNIASLPATALQDLAAFVAWMHTEWGVPLAAAPRWTGPNTTARMSWPEFASFKGVLGHQHVPGNVHWDPGQIDAKGIITRAQQLLNPPKPPTPPEPAVRTLLNINCQWPGFASSKKALPWSQRVQLLADAVLKSGASIVTAQELGKAEAADLSKLLPGWKYQRANGGGKGLNCVFWLGSEWAFHQLFDRNLDSFGQLQRTLIAVMLKHEDGSFVWAGSTHLAAAASDLSNADAIKARTRQAQQIGTLIGSPTTILGGDWNSPYPQSSATSVRGILHAAGFTFRAPLKDSKHDGIDGVGAKANVTILTEKVYPLGKASDHEGRLVTFTTKRG